jgi:hypothetical protein
MLILFAACLCHDGFSTAYNAKAEIPLGILFNDQSVLETHHCTVAISVLTRENANIFQSIDDRAMAAVWPTFRQLILPTDMYRHFDIIEDFRKVLESGRKWTDDPKSRLTMMQLLNKKADLSTATRSFQTADKFSLNVCEEFFRQGQLDKVQGFVYEPGFGDRDHLDKEKSQIAFYKEVCLPLFEILGKGVPTLGTLPQHLKANIGRWEERRSMPRRREEEAKEVEDAERAIDAIELDEAAGILDKA